MERSDSYGLGDLSVTRCVLPNFNSTAAIEVTLDPTE